MLGLFSEELLQNLCEQAGACSTAQLPVWTSFVTVTIFLHSHITYWPARKCGGCDAARTSEYSVQTIDGF